MGFFWPNIFGTVLARLVIHTNINGVTFKKSKTAFGNREREISILLLLQIRGICKLLISDFALYILLKYYLG